MRYVFCSLLMTILLGSCLQNESGNSEKIESATALKSRKDAKGETKESFGQPELEKKEIERREPISKPSDSVPDSAPEGWTELSALIPSIVLDMRYATTNNFVKEVLYDCPKCFVKPNVAAALAKIQAKLTSDRPGYRLKMYDCYRPKPVQQRLWDIVPDPNYVTPPHKGSMHNRGLAVDITLVDEKGSELDMGTEFDFFGPEAHFDYQDHPAEVLANRQLLRSLMEQHGFRGIRTEWWHFSLSTPGTAVSDWTWACPE